MGEAAEDHLNECYANGDIPDEAAMFKEQRDRWRGVAVEKDKELTEARAEIGRWKEKSHAAVDAADRKIKRLETRLAAMQTALEGLEKYLDEETARAFTEMNKARQDGDDEWATIHQRVRDAYSDATMRARAALSQKGGGKE